MRKQMVTAILASSALATPALARDDSWYIEIDGGVALVEDMPLVLTGTPTNLPTGNALFELGSKTGYDLGGIVGRDFGLFRIELEGSYRRAGLNKFDGANGIGFGTSGTNEAEGSGGKAGISSAESLLIPGALFGGHTSSTSLMLNGLIDVGQDDGIQAFVGGGVGYAHTKIKMDYSVSTPGFDLDANIDDGDGGFAWQLLAGLRYPLSDHVDIGMKYRYFVSDNVDVVFNETISGEGTFSASAPMRTKWRSHSALLTLGYNFGHAAPPPPPPPLPPPPPPPPPVDPPAPPPPPPPCNKGPYIVFFDWDKSDITTEASAVLDSAVTAYGNCASVPIMLAGYADRSGKPAYNQGLSERRNAAVTAYLTQRGIPAGAISSQGFGETNNRVPTADGVRELQNRRVEITYGPGSGM